MAKKIAIGVLLALLIGGAWWQNAYINSATERLLASLAAVEQALEVDAYDDAFAAADAFSKIWEQKKQIYEALIHHEDIDVISASAARMRSFCATNYKKGALAEVQALSFYIQHLKDIDSVRWENIL